jgi:alpha-N-arabinofuranosidase
MEFTPQNEHECAGLALIQNKDFYFLLVLTQGAQPVLRLVRRANGIEVLLAEKAVAPGRICLRVEAHEQAYHFSFSNQADEWKVLAESVDGRILSTPVAGGFVGAFIAMYASSNGQPSANNADFDWFEYIGWEQ